MTLVGSTGQMKASAERRTELAAERNVFAAERTYAAWVRTGSRRWQAASAPRRH